MQAEALVKACQETSAAATLALSWINDARNADKVRAEKSALERSFRRAAFQSGKLEAAIGRPMCVGVFGPSQCGKSYLVSVLARKNDQLTACFDDPQRPRVDFIKEINPSGGKEATGLVTRFSVEAVQTPPGFPVALRLLSQTEIVKILANTYGNEGDPEFETPLDTSVIEEKLKSAEGAAGRQYRDALREEDIWDLQEYFQRSLKRFEWARRLDPYWDRIARAAPRLTVADRAELFSLFWGGHQPLTTLYARLVGALQKLGFPTDAFCQMDALLPSAKSILNVDTLAGISRDDGERLRVVAGSTAADLPRALVTAVVAELRIQVQDKPWDFFDYTDLLDFPGYRSRTPIRLEKMFKETPDTTVKDMFLRGKVDFLFQRYTSDQELTSMLLCLRDSNLEVATLPAVVDEWISVTHGASPSERVGKSILLFFVLTFFDMHLIERAGDDGNDKKVRFESRMHASLLRPFGSGGNDWPNQWTPGEPFRNCYWIRNPNVKSEGVIEYDNFRELRVLPRKEREISDLKTNYLTVSEVRDHFRDPERAWDEVMKLNDGGIGYLAENVAKVCKPNMKADQVRSNLVSLRKRLYDQFERYYVSTDVEVRLKQRLAVAREILRDIDMVRKRKHFGVLIRALCVDRVRLSDALFEARTRVGGADGPSDMPDIVGVGSHEPSLEDIFGDNLVSAAPKFNSRFLGLGGVAINTWTAHMHAVAANEAFCKFIGMRTTTLDELIHEIVDAANRRQLAESLAERMERVIHIESTDAIVAKATIVCEHEINRFVSTLGYDKIAPEKRPTPPSKSEPGRPIFNSARVVYDGGEITATPAPFGFDYVVDWFTAFQQVVKDNATSVDGAYVDVEQNAKLKDILTRLQAPI